MPCRGRLLSFPDSQINLLKTLDGKVLGRLMLVCMDTTTRISYTDPLLQGYVYFYPESPVTDRNNQGGGCEMAQA